MKKQFSYMICLILSAFIISSCSYKKEAKEVTQNFFSAIKNQQIEKMNELYPDVDSLSNYYKSDTIIINEVSKLGNNKYSVTVTNKFTNGFGKSTETKIVIFTKPKDENKPSNGYEIYDSQGLCNRSDDAIYKYAKRKGYLKGNNLTDQEVSRKISEANKEWMKDVLKFINYMDRHLIVSNWAWETNEFNYGAYGSGSVKNNTKYSLPKVKYIITYTTKNGTEVTEDSGIVTYDRIRPHGSASFSFYTPYVGNAKYASIRLEIDPMFMFEKLAEGDVPF